MCGFKSLLVHSLTLAPEEVVGLASVFDLSFRLKSLPAYGRETSEDSLTLAPEEGLLRMASMPSERDRSCASHLVDLE